MNLIEKTILDGDLPQLQRMTAQDPRLIQGSNADGLPYVFLAARAGHLAIVSYLLEYTGVSMNMRDDKQRGILHHAAFSGDVPLCQYLVERVGMSPTEGDIDLDTPYEIAAQEGHQALVSYFESVVGAPLSRMYHNPIRTGFFPDPSIVRVGNDYYMVNSTFAFFPCIPISHSTDLVHWHIIGHAITNPEWSMLDGIRSGNGYWAPDISYHEGRFYITVTLRLNDDPLPASAFPGEEASVDTADFAGESISVIGGHAYKNGKPLLRHNDHSQAYRLQIIVSSDTPEGPYSRPAVIEEDGIDPSLFTDQDGRRYMLLNRGARILELDEAATRRISPAEMLYYGENKRNPEGPHLLYKDGYYYIFLAEGGTGYGHMVTVARSRTLKGVYEPCPYNPIMTQKDPAARIQRCGHGDLVETPDGSWYMVYLCGRKYLGTDGEPRSILGRETSMDPVTWTPDGWPIVNQLDGPSALQIAPRLGATPAAAYPDFSQEALRLYWMFPRIPTPDAWSFRDGVLRLASGPADLHALAARNVFLRRQTDTAFTADVLMRIPALQRGQEAGMVCYYDELTYLKFSLGGDGAVHAVEHIEDTERTYPPVPVPAGIRHIWFRIMTHVFDRILAVSFDGTHYQEVAHLPNVDYLCDEGSHKGKRFTGPLVGLYACHADQKPFYAEYEDFIYTGGVFLEKSFDTASGL